jgi:hypothetical protein
MVEYQRQSKIEDKPRSSDEFKEVINAFGWDESYYGRIALDTYSAEQATIQQTAMIQPRL